jgi:hypothetical protein
MKLRTYWLKSWISILVLGVLFTFTNCEKENELFTEETSEETITTQEKDITEKAYPNKSGEVTEITYQGQQLTVEKIDGLYVFEGDILITPEELQNANKSTGRTKKLWPNCIVYYSIESSLPNKQRVYDAIAHWKSKTNLQFVKRTNQTAYINFRKIISGCSSQIGRTGGKQNINLANGCSTGNTIHEIGHAIGLWHEQSRKDRNTYVNINFANIQPGKEHNFKTYVQLGKDGDEYSPTLDFGSIMMYGPYAFSKNGKPTITKKNGSTYSVQRNALSIWDRIGVSRMYKKVCGTVPNMSGYYKANDGGHYYVRHIGTNVYWFGEHPSGSWANIFTGKLDGNKITGQFYDVPKGKIQGRGPLKLTVNYNSTKITKTAGSNFGGSIWTKTRRPSNLPGTRTAGFGVRNNINNLTARWYANDGGYYYIRQVGTHIVWFGERHFTSGRPPWSNVGTGVRIGNIIYLNWADVPKGNANNNGTLILRVDTANKMTRTYVTGGFSGSSWSR